MPRHDDPRYFPISPLLIVPQALGSFSVFIRKDERLILYAKAGETFTERHSRRLHENGTSEVYVRVDQRQNFGLYLERHLAHILEDDRLPVEHRASAFHCATTELLRDTFGTRLPAPVDGILFERLQSLVTMSLRFLCEQGTLKALGQLLDCDFSAYSHSVNVYALTVPLLARLGYAQTDLVRTGLGVLLHDIGLARLPRAITRHRHSLTKHEEHIYRTHPTLGVGLVAQVPLSQEALHCIMLHHERLDGSGFPAGVKDENIPTAVRALAIADTYDLLTTAPGEARLTPFMALQLMRSEHHSTLDLYLLREFITMLSDAEMAGVWPDTLR
ncbi:MAG TPA: HD domain-containing protein [Desulfovibrio sp.]|jgi:HD-GYP domain-containing protein (c-di-GMP phosphodiesterase class II)|uniref:HD domain protein n=2 Tax=Nitratidesulfovibrio vulgaris TaxID=881 RepID=Q72EB1_NITV2|nr:HD domain protein [Nitratidesulfovibrio vulgaris str. Hildenborough]ABM29309.1 metal dependent phosphohydrolase [Nitratidesulfovibrio vulgaris DP4]ADP85781.1 metal dependent phosphohydrolase [Nitratidesulfovibrio vulgaris RCH1]GEB79952.1 HD family phosphohydrolase [Desulfovibrio desulfuricans]HBW15327.1 HD domain-containing protein [Desulfovibrio sp.]